MGQIVHASINEHGHITGGKPGDQNGKEVLVRDWYNKPWTHMCRYPSAEVAAEAAYIGVKIANSRLTGYDQNRRDTLRYCLKQYKWDVDAYLKSSKKSDCDCGSFVRACYACVLPKVRGGKDPYTSSSCISKYKEAGFTIHTQSKFLTSSKYLKPGDILVAKGHHVAMYVGKSSELDMSDSSSGGGGSSSGGGGSSAGSTSTNQPIVIDRNNAILRDVGYLSNDLKPSIQASGVNLLLINTIGSGFGMTGSETGATSSSSYNIDKLTSKQKAAIKFLTGKGLNLAASVGILANIMHESGLNTACVGDHGTSFGICQWHNERGKNMKSYVGSDWASDLTGQLKFLWSELSSGYKTTLQSLKQVKDTLDGCKKAADIFVRQFERPAKVDEQSSKRQATAATLWNKCSITQKTSSGNASANSSNKKTSDTSLPGTKMKKSVKVPASVPQSGISTNSTNYVYWYSKFVSPCRRVADEWDRLGRKSSRGIATIAGYYLCALSPVFGNTGDIVRVILKDGTAIGCIMADVKGSDKTNTYGHNIAGKGQPPQIDIVEWYIIGKKGTSSVMPEKLHLKISEWRHKKVDRIENYGSYWRWKKKP